MDANGWIDVKEMTDAEQRVRAHWERVEGPLKDPLYHDRSVRIVGIGCFPTWQAANEFTEERQRERAKLAREMDLLHPIIYDLRGEIACNGAGRKDREETLTKWLSILARLQAALTELERGMKKEAK